MNLGILLNAMASRYLGKTALVSGEESISYERLDRSTTSLARWFIKQGCRPGDRVALHWINSIEMAKLLFACFKAGLIAVPINVAMKAPEISYILAHSKAALCMAHPALAARTREAARDWFDGRRKEIIVRGGSNISPQEVEEVIYSHPAVLEAAVIGVPAPLYGQSVVAYVALRDGLAANEQELREYAGERLAENKIPERIVFLPSLPKGITGKVQRRALKEMAAAAAA